MLAAGNTLYLHPLPLFGIDPVLHPILGISIIFLADTSILDNNNYINNNNCIHYVI